MSTSTRILVSASFSWAGARLMEPARTTTTSKRKRRNRFAISLFTCPSPLHPRPGLDKFCTTKKSLLDGRGQSYFRQRSDLAAPEFVTGFPHRPQHGRPVLEVGGKNLLHHAMGEFGDQAVHHGRRITLFIGQPGPVQIVGVPRLRQQPA